MLSLGVFCKNPIFSKELICSLELFYNFATFCKRNKQKLTSDLLVEKLPYDFVRSGVLDLLEMGTSVFYFAPQGKEGISNLKFQIIYTTIRYIGDKRIFYATQSGIYHS